MGLLSALRQSFFLPAAPLTEQNIGSLAGKVCIITGGNSGVGFELSQILYGAGATVFLAGRNEQACNEAIDRIRAKHAASTGRLEFLRLDLGDLSGVKGSAADFLARADRLDFLCNNAGVMFPPDGSTGAQGHELQLVTNCLGPYLFTEQLTPVLVHTARSERELGNENVVRVAWAGSLGIDTSSPKGGVTLETRDGLEQQKSLGSRVDYGQSKTGNLFLATGWGKEVENEGIISTCFNPGNLRTNLQRNIQHKFPGFAIKLINTLIYPAINGAYTELYCGFSKDLTTADNGTYIAPWGRKFPVRDDIETSRTGEIGQRYMEMVRRETKAFM